MTVQKLGAWIPVGAEDLIDSGMVDGPFLAELKAGVAKRIAEEDARWRALPWTERVRRTLYYWSWMIPWRIKEWIHRDCE